MERCSLQRVAGFCLIQEATTRIFKSQNAAVLNVHGGEPEVSEHHHMNVHVRLV